MRSSAKLALLALVVGASGALVVTPARSAVAEVVVHDSGAMGTFGGRSYTWITATMSGTVQRDDGSVGSYRVPITLNYPDRGSNGFGLVDVVNDASYMWYTEGTAGLGTPTTLYTGDLIFSDYLRREGFTYISVQWYYPAVQRLPPRHCSHRTSDRRERDHKGRSETAPGHR